MKKWFFLLLPLTGALACKQAEKKKFEKLPAEQTGIDFTNTITEDREHNVFTYQYYYNGNGVAVGDVNNDGLTDVFFTGNQVASKLYLNKGDFRFEDITAAAGVAGTDGWRTGATMVDINADGLLDIYVCYSGFGDDAERSKQLFVNKGLNKDGKPVFKEQAVKFGIDAPGTYTSQAAFFDMDLDGDLDLFLLNHANEFYSPFFNTRRLRNLRHPQYGNRLYRNDAGHFTEISAAAGIYGSGLNFGLGIAVSDLNNDGWPDILVSNDFHEQDYLYLNNRNGTFKEISQQAFAHSSRNTMGLDIADYNNDLLPDVITLDMLPESNYRQKILQGADEYDKYMLMVDSGYGHQNNRNMLQLHQGFDKDSIPVFAEIGQLAGVSNTDWSWAALFADFDNDGWKDLFVTNGYLRESTNLDFMKYQVATAMKNAIDNGLDVSTIDGYNKNMPLYELVKSMPATKLSSYMFSNKKDLQFNNSTTDWGLDEPGVSSGAAYADLNNDGLLDLIVCRNNDPVNIYKNTSTGTSANNFLKIKLKADQQNVFGLGAKVMVTTDSFTQVQEMYPVRGYQSSVDYVLNFGLGSATKVKEIKVIWPGGAETLITAPALNALVVVDKKDAKPSARQALQNNLLFTDVSANSLDFRHNENVYVDFKREMLVPYQLSRMGPKVAVADVNGDGIDDIFITGAAGQSGKLYLQTTNQQFAPARTQPWQKDLVAEDIASVFFDADKDGDKDLYVTSGGSEWFMAGPELQDRLYLNDGKGNFIKGENILPNEVYNGTCVTVNDFDKDGDEDLFVGAGAIPGKYPLSAGNIILRNDFDDARKQLRFTDITASLAGDALWKAGMVNDAVWADINKDGWNDLVIAGDWMPVMVFYNQQGKKFRDATKELQLTGTNGWWKKIIPADVDHDGDIDLIAGNMGTNTQFKTDKQHPLTTYAVDFSNDGRIIPVMTRYIGDTCSPFNSRDELIEQMPVLNKKFLLYADFAKASLKDLIGEDRIKKSKSYEISNTQSSIFINNNGIFESRALPVQAQFSAVNTILYKDFNADGKEDILLAGNFYPFRVQQGRCDAGMGLLLAGDNTGNFKVVPRDKTGLLLTGDIRDGKELKSKDKSVYVFAKNNDRLQVIRNN